MQVKTEFPAAPMPRRGIQADISPRGRFANQADRNADSKAAHATARPSVAVQVELPERDSSATPTSLARLAGSGFESAIGQLDSLEEAYGLSEERLTGRMAEAGGALAAEAASAPGDALAAHDMATLTRDQMLVQPADAWAAQASISPRSALALLR